VKEYPYWWDTVPNRDTRTPNPESLFSSESRFQAGESRIPNRDAISGRRFDVAVIGAGYTGLSAARVLARAGASVVVLERERAGWGASSRNGGQVLTGTKLDPPVLVARYGEARARQLFDASREAIASLEQVIATESIACDYERTGHIQAAWKPAHYRAFRDQQELLARVFAHRVELIPRSEQRLELGSDAYHGLLVDPASAAINPAKYVVGLTAAAVRAGVVILEQTPVASFSRALSGWTVRIPRGDIGVRDVLVATNGYTNGAAPALRRRLIPVGSYVIATEPLPAAEAAVLLPRRRVAFDSKRFLFYFRLSADNRVVFGGRAEFAVATPETTRHAAGLLRRGLVRIFPQLGSVRVDYAWSGNVAFTRDRLPHAGTLEGVYYAGGYCGHGIATATYLGTLIGRRMAGEEIEHPLFDDHFPPIPLYGGTPWFLPLVGAYYRIRDCLG
jgi:glycine/D-amino acid oxidase-like deaminating enzyme